MSIYIRANQQTSGPYEESAVMAWLHAGQVSPEVLACRHGATQWQPLRSLFTAADPAVPWIAGPQVPFPELIESWARQSLPNRLDVKVMFNSIGFKVFGYIALFFLPALIFVVAISFMLRTGNFDPRELAIPFGITVFCVLLLLVIKLNRSNWARYLDAEGVQTLNGKKHRWENLGQIQQQKWGARAGGIKIQMFFRTGKAVIWQGRIQNFGEITRLLNTIPAPVRRS